MNIFKLKNELSSKYFDYQALIQALGDNSHKRRTIGKLIKDGYIIRVKKGLYVWSQEVDPRSCSRELLANLIYGPSYVSLEYALSYYGLIPERVGVLTSVTTKKTKKRFTTPIGEFHYHYLNPKAYAHGVSMVALNEFESFFIASKEKAVLDTLFLRRHGEKFSCFKEAYDYLEQSFRIDRESLESLNIIELAKNYPRLPIKIGVS